MWQPNPEFPPLSETPFGAHWAKAEQSMNTQAVMAARRPKQDLRTVLPSRLS